MTYTNVHRILSICVVLVTFYLGVTGTLIESVDFRTIVTQPSPFDPNLMAMREDFAGPPNFRVLATADYLAAPLPTNADFEAMLSKVVGGARTSLGAAPLKFVELRMAGSRAIGQVQTGDRTLRFDAASGAALGVAPQPLAENEPPKSLRNTIKHLHRMTSFGDWALWINVTVASALVILIVTGTVMYIRVYRARRRLRRTNPYWKAGGWWRALHRSTAISAALFLSIVVLSGGWLAVESLVFGQYLSAHFRDHPGAPLPMGADASTPLVDHELAPMLQTTLNAWRQTAPATPIRVVRLRIYGGMRQGVIISGERVARQLVFDARTGQRTSLTEPGYPEVGFPFGWQAHQIAKSIHRGDFFGLTGRFMSLIAGLAMTYLSLSGIVMYYRMWQKRRLSGRKKLFWK